MSRLSDLLNPTPSSTLSAPAVSNPEYVRSQNNYVDSDRLGGEKQQEPSIPDAETPRTTSLPAAVPVEPPNTMRSGSGPASPKLDRYHHGSGSPTLPTSRIQDRSASPAVKLAPLQNVGASLETNSVKSPPEQTSKLEVQSGDTAFTPVETESISAEVEARQADVSMRDASPVPRDDTKSPQASGLPATKSSWPKLATSPVPRVKTEQSLTPREATPSYLATITNTIRPQENAPLAPTARPTNKSKENVNLKGKASVISSKSNSNSASRDSSSVQSVSRVKKRQPVKTAAPRKTGAAVAKTPQAKKRKLDVESANGSTLTRRSGTPASSRASKTPAASNRKQSSTPAPSHGSPTYDDDDDDDDDEHDEDDAGGDGSEVFCVCRRPDNHTWMIGCDGGCEDWFHGACVNIEEEDGDLIDKYICPRCEKAGKGNTTWKPMCRLDGCHQPARLSMRDLSKYCSDDHGREFMRRRAPLAPPKASKMDSRILGTEDDTDDDLTVGGPLSRGQLAAVAKGVKDVTSFRALGDAILSPPPTAGGDGGGDGSMKLGDGKASEPLNEDEDKLISEINRQREKLVQHNKALKDRERFLQLVKERSKRVVEELSGVKEICGYDARLSWTDEEFLDWKESEDGKAAFARGELGPPARQDSSVEGDDDICQKKRCERHKQWRNTRAQDIRFEESKNAEELRRLKQQEGEVKQTAKLRRIREAEGDRAGTVEVVQ
ncbi:MAG: hypothetical protein M1825_006448 [Sarcosagium campestre]|nr:MAG: hypothetical protein M1825_006448 [Sarcosagium campestre]